MPKNPKSYCKLSADPVKAKGKGWAWLVVGDFSVSEPLFLRSGHGQVMVLLYSTKMNVILYSEQNGQSPNAQLSLFRGPSPDQRGRSQLASSFRAMFPHPSQLSSLGSQHPTQLALSP